MRRPPSGHPVPIPYLRHHPVLQPHHRHEVARAAVIRPLVHILALLGHDLARRLARVQGHGPQHARDADAHRVGGKRLAALHDQAGARLAHAHQAAAAAQALGISILDRCTGAGNGGH